MESKIQYLVKKRLTNPIIGFLKIGITPVRLSIAITVGFALGLSPLYGLTTILCASVAIVFRLNFPATQIFNFLLWPIQVVLIIPYIRLGELLFNREKLGLTKETLKAMFDDSWLETLKTIGDSIFFATVAWLIVIIPISIGIYFLFHFFIKRISFK